MVFRVELDKMVTTFPMTLTFLMLSHHVNYREKNHDEPQATRQVVSNSHPVIESFADKIEKNHYGKLSSADAGSRLRMLPNCLSNYRYGICGNIQNCLANFPYFFPVTNACSANAKELAEEFECEAIKECTDP